MKLPQTHSSDIRLQIYYRNLTMKRNITENSTRATAGCLPVLLFNQKKRTRMPLTSNPMEHEPGSNNFFPTPESFDSPPTGNKELTQSRTQGNQTAVQNNYRAQFQYPNRRSNMDNTHSAMAPMSKFTKSMNTGQLQQQVRQPQQIQESRKFPHGSNMGQSSKNSWNQQVPTAQQSQGHRPFSGSNTVGQSEKAGWKSCVPSESYKAQAKSQQTHQWPKSSSQNSASNKRIGQPNQFFENQSESNPSDGVDQKSKPLQMKIMQPDNSLRIVTTTIEGMKHWTQYNQRCALLFEVLAPLDSAVRAGEQSAKEFLLRDRKDSVPSVFYETDRDLPRLIRGQVHRCMGTYDQRRNLFKCVSVRSASAEEQKTFAEFVSVADAEMTQFVKTLNEV
ncbi:spermatogenesis-associated protein 22 isoform X3 [Mustelus asterias]